MRKSVFAAALAAAVAIPSVAEASVTITSGSGNLGWLTSRIVYTPGGIGGSATRTSVDVYAGRTRLTGYDNDTLEAVTFDSYCIDIFNFLSTNNAVFEVGDFSLTDNQKKSDLMTLLLSSASDIANESSVTAQKRISAAIQLAVWEIVNESSGNPYSIGSGIFSVSSSYGSVINGTATNASALTRAQAYLDGLPNASVPAGNRLQTLNAVNPLKNQRQVFISAVPEPATWGLLMIGFGAIGGAMRTRRKAKISFA